MQDLQHGWKSDLKSSLFFGALIRDPSGWTDGKCLKYLELQAKNGMDPDFQRGILRESFGVPKNCV